MRDRVWCLLIIFTGLFSYPNLIEGEERETHLLIQLLPGTSISDLSIKSVSEWGALGQTYNELGIQEIILSDSTNTLEAINYWRSIPGVLSVDIDHKRQATVLDPKLISQWYIPRIRVDQTWELTTGREAVTVAVLDSGVQDDHPDIKGQILAGINVLGDGVPNQDTSDDLGHGTLVAGIIAAIKDNGIGGSGIAPDVRILPVKVLDNDGYGNDSDIIEGIIWAADHGASIINLSLGGPDGSSALRAAIQYAVNRGVLVVAASGNYTWGESGNVQYPAAIPEVIAVGSVDRTDQRSSFSAYGQQLDVTAPGVDIISTQKDGNYSELQNGTSFAAPMVSALAAMIVSIDPTMRPSEIKALIEMNAIDLYPKGWDAETGWGRIDVKSTLFSIPIVRQINVLIRKVPAKTWNGTIQLWTDDGSKQLTWYRGDEIGMVNLGPLALGSYLLKVIEEGYLPFENFLTVSSGMEIEREFVLLFGDLDGNRIIETRDLDILAGQYVKQHTNGDFEQWVDANEDGRIDLFDFIQLSKNIGEE